MTGHEINVICYNCLNSEIITAQVRYNILYPQFKNLIFRTNAKCMSTAKFIFVLFSGSGSHNMYNQAVSSSGMYNWDSYDGDQSDMPNESEQSEHIDNIFMQSRMSSSDIGYVINCNTSCI